jgi:hypothetical protein
MRRKVLIALAAATAIGASSAAMAAGHGMGGHSMGGHSMGGHSMGGSMGMSPSMGMSGPKGALSGPMSGPKGAWKGPTTFNQGPKTFKSNKFAFDRHRDFRFRHHRHNRFFFDVGFAGPYYDSCWVWTPYGWRYVCGYPYGGYGYPYGGYGYPY